MENTTTPFQLVYDNFLDRVTEDMYVSWTEEDTRKDLKNILKISLTRFEYPKVKIYDYDENAVVKLENGEESLGRFNCILNQEEINILGELMVIEWISRQILTVDNTRMKYGSSDFKFTSQANHLGKMLKLKESTQLENKHAQRLYGRRKRNEEGYVKPSLSGLAGGAIQSARSDS